VGQSTGWDSGQDREHREHSEQALLLQWMSPESLQRYNRSAAGLRA
jgi:hypothetical protein